MGPLIISRFGWSAISTRVGECRGLPHGQLHTDEECIHPGAVTPKRGLKSRGSPLEPPITQDTGGLWVALPALPPANGNS